MLGRIATIRRAANEHSITVSDDVRSGGADSLKVEIPETGLSLDQVERFLHQSLGHARRLNGVVSEDAGGHVSIEIGLSGADPIRVEGNAADLDKLMQQAAEQASPRSTRPTMSSICELWAEKRMRWRRPSGLSNSPRLHSISRTASPSGRTPTATAAAPWSGPCWRRRPIPRAGRDGRKRRRRAGNWAMTRPRWNIFGGSCRRNSKISGAIIAPRFRGSCAGPG